MTDQSQLNNRLLACPFCGKEATTDKGTHHNAQLWVKCPDSGCPAGQDYATPNLWNTRV